MKEGFVLKSMTADAAEMEKINLYTRRVYGPEEVYTFSLVLCDNEVDRDFERFSIPALEKLRELFLGKTCILDHERRTLNQTARIYDTAIETEPGRMTQAGETYTCLTARAYLPRTERNRETVELIESGILKEVSVSCAVKRSVCSVCGKEQCSHRKGNVYGGRVCSRILEEPTDAYECSFVAVPAQREAGVRKGWRQADGGELLERVKQSDSAGLCMTAGEAARLREKLLELEDMAALGETCRKDMEADILKYGAIAQPGVPRDVIKASLQGLDIAQMKALRNAYEAMAAEKLPIRPQLAPKRDEQREAGNGAYQI